MILLSDRKKSFVLYHSFYPAIKKLTIEERGYLLTAIFDYEIDGELSVELPFAAELVFSMIREVLDRNREEYMERCAKNAANGRKGGLRRAACAGFYDEEDSV